MKTKSTVIALAVLLTAFAAPVASAQDIGARLDAAIAGEHRSAKDRARDVYRHPKETLLFMGLEPDLTVVEIWPGGGWYSDILAPVLKPNGIYYAASFASSADKSQQWRIDAHKRYMKKLEASPDAFDHVVVTELSVPERTTIAPPGSVDMVLTFRNVHNWMKGEYAEEMFAVFDRMIKPGGVLGIVEHRAKPGTSIDAMKQSGYVTEEHVIALAEGAGFVLEARSDINANPGDTADHPAGVWTLPPSLRHCRGMDDGAAKDSCVNVYTDIGESDRMTLRFRKPAG